jgi:hypothetical protein
LFYSLSYFCAAKMPRISRTGIPRADENALDKDWNGRDRVSEGRVAETDEDTSSMTIDKRYGGVDPADEKGTRENASGLSRWVGLVRSFPGTGIQDCLRVLGPILMGQQPGGSAVALFAEGHEFLRGSIDIPPGLSNSPVWGVS